MAKHKVFVDTLEKMKVCEQPGNSNSVVEYSTLWLELIDRGGLYQINDTVFKLMECIEIVTRKHFSVSHMETGVNIISVIRKEAFTTGNGSMISFYYYDVNLYSDFSLLSLATSTPRPFFQWL